MQLEDEDIREFIQLWQEEFDEILLPEAARRHASQLLALYERLADAGPQVPPHPPSSP